MVLNSQFLSVKIPAFHRKRNIPGRQRAAGKFRREQIAAFAQPGQVGGKIDEALHDDVDDKADPLQAATHGEKARRHHGAAVFAKGFRPDDDVGGAGFIFDGQEYDAFRRTRALPYQHQAGNGDKRILRKFLAAQFGITDSAKRVETVAEKPDGMRLQRQPGGDLVLDDVFGERHGR